jgi:hypothetical protein
MAEFAITRTKRQLIKSGLVDEHWTADEWTRLMKI